MLEMKIQTNPSSNEIPWNETARWAEYTLQDLVGYIKCATTGGKLSDKCAEDIAIWQERKYIESLAKLCAEEGPLAAKFYKILLEYRLIDITVHGNYEDVRSQLGISEDKFQQLIGRFTENGILIVGAPVMSLKRPSGWKYLEPLILGAKEFKELRNA
jgi:hypothetical protein